MQRDWVPLGVHELAGMVWPVACAGCGQRDREICDGCRARLTGTVRKVPVPLLVAEPRPEVWAAVPYAGAAARVIVSWKERGRHQLTAELAAVLAEVLVECRAARESREAPWSRADRQRTGSASPDAEWLIVPVPTTAANRRRRGADLILELADRATRAAPSLGWPGQPPRSLRALRHVRRVQDQAGLGAAGRRDNLAGALSVPARFRPVVRDRCAIVVDDVVTTGATAAEASRALMSAGARVVGVCCLCVTMRRLGVPDVAMLV